MAVNHLQTLFTTTGITDSTRMIHTPGDFSKKNLLYVQEVGRLKSLQPHKSSRENLDSYLMMGVLSGEGVVVVGGTEYKVKKGNIVFLNCMEHYEHESSEKKPWELAWVHFNGNIAGAYFEQFAQKSGGTPVFSTKNMKEYEKLIDKLMDYQQHKELESELKSGEILLQLCNMSLINAITKEKQVVESDYELYNEIRELVNDKYTDKGLMETIVSKFGADEEELNIGFKKCYGIELRDYILNRRFNAAKELLRFTIKPVKEIVDESGIGNVDLFRRLFLDSEGMSAEDYRNRWAQWVK